MIEALPYFLMLIAPFLVPDIIREIRNLLKKD